MRRLLPVLLLLGACSRPQPPLSQALQKSLDGLALKPPCDAVVAMEWARSWPVPQPDGGVRVLFFPVTGNPATGPTLFAPTAEAVVTSSGAVTQCRAIKGQARKLGQRRFGAEAMALDDAAFERKTAELYDATEAVLKAYAKQGQTTDQDREAAKRYAELFLLLAEPDLLLDYYRANPAFWEWLRQAGAPSLKRP